MSRGVRTGRRTPPGRRPPYRGQGHATMGGYRQLDEENRRRDP
ncbi:hypothetical protein ACWD4Z_37590 [Streptomyces antibioticus]